MPRETFWYWFACECRRQECGALTDLLAGTLYVLAGLGVDADDVVFVDEERHIDHGARFNFYLLGASLGGIATDGRRSFDNFEIHLDWELYRDGLAIVLDGGNQRIWLEKLSALS